jgi:hypothetical protein
LFTGAVASAMIGEIQVSYLYEFDPQLAVMPLLNVGSANPGTMTLPAITNMFK